MQWQLSSDQAAAIERQSCSFGFAVVSDQAVAVGVSAVPTPVSQMGSDLWFVHENMWADESNLTDRTRSASRGSIDSRAMRKVDIGQDIVSVVELGTVSSGLIFEVAGRMLIKVN